MSEVLSLLTSGQYALGLARAHALAHPAPDDLRWAAACALNLGRTLEARDLLLRAHAAGCVGARVDLATVARFLGDLDEAWEHLDALDTDGLGAVDRALFWREQAMLHYAASDLTRAARAAERAWHSTFEAPDAVPWQAGVAQVLGLIYSARGQDRRAEAHFGTALANATPGRAAYVRMTRAACRARLGRHDDAREDLDAADALAGDAPGIRAVLAYHHGNAAYTRGQGDEAFAHWERAEALAHEASEPETEAYAHLGLAAVLTWRGDAPGARRHLARAGALQVTPATSALLELRRGAYAVRFDEPGGDENLRRALDAFGRLQRDREAGWAELHLAEHALRLGDRALADEALGRATDRRHALGSGASLAPELRALPRVRAHLHSLGAGHYLRALLDDARAAPGTLPFEVRLHTLGDARLLVDGVSARIDIARAPELLAYLLRRPERRLEQVIADLSPDDDPKKARNYWHQARYALEHAAPGLRIPHGPDKTYSVRCDGPALTWDVLDLEAALKERSEAGMERALDVYGGPFLPGADSTWASEERQDMAWSVVKVGLELIEDWYAREEYGKCLTLAGRLLDVDPYDDTLAEYLVKAVRALQGDVTARRTVARLVARHEHDMGSAPPVLRELQHELARLN